MNKKEASFLYFCLGVVVGAFIIMLSVTFIGDWRFDKNIKELASTPVLNVSKSISLFNEINESSIAIRLSNPPEHIPLEFNCEYNKTLMSLYSSNSKVNITGIEFCNLLKRELSK